MKRDARFCFAVFAFCLAASTACFAGERRHDPLPPRFAAMSEYDKIALEPYRDTYDRMPLHEKARVHSQAFEFMNDRKPDYPPAVIERIRQSREAANARSAYDAKKHMYKPAPGAEERRAARSPEAKEAKMLSGIPMPWAKDEPPPGPEDDVETFNEDDYRMESLRPGSLRVEREER